MRRLAIMSIAVLARCAAFGQAPDRQPAFEVASVKPAAPVEVQPGRPRRTGGLSSTTGAGDPGLVVYSGVILKAVLSKAYNVPPDQIVGPSWLDSERYDIVAKVPKDAPEGQIPAMLQNLLAERFHMSVHLVTKQTQGYALVVGKSGPKLTKSAKQDEASGSFGFTSSGHLTWRAETLASVARSLSLFLGRPVVDMTEIQGRFDITLDASPDSLPGLHSFGTAQADADPQPSIFAAVRALGLNLEPREAAVKQLVVDSAQKIPTQN
jgi:uncharacterized protein (TIGR03435 family)